MVGVEDCPLQDRAEPELPVGRETQPASARVQQDREGVGRAVWGDVSTPAHSLPTSDLLPFLPLAREPLDAIPWGAAAQSQAEGGLGRGAEKVQHGSHADFCSLMLSVLDSFYYDFPRDPPWLPLLTASTLISRSQGVASLHP